MRHLVILGGGTAGTMIANKLRHRLDRTEWNITVVDRDDEHHYQPGYLFLPFGGYSHEQVVRSRHAFLPDGVDFVVGAVDKVEPDENVVLLEGGRRLPYDQLVIATGTTPRPDQTPGHAGPGVAAQHLRLLHARGRGGARRGARPVRQRPAGRAHHRDADQVPGGAPGVHLPRRGLAASSAGSATGSSWST